MKQNEQFENITLTLDGTDPVRLIRETLEKFNLSTDNLPKSASTPQKSHDSSSPSSNKWPTPDDLWDDLQMREAQLRRKKRSSYFTNGRSLLNNLVKDRDVAMDRCSSFQKTTELLEDEIEILKAKTGAKSVSWWVGVFSIPTRTFF